MAGKRQPQTRLTDYLIELSHDVEKLNDFWRNRSESLRGSGLSRKHREALVAGDLGRILRYVREENADDYTLIVLSPMAPINCPAP